jgi:hypothetical protein
MIQPMAKERYRKISVRMWNDREFMSLSNDAKLIWVYILTCPAMLPFGAMRATMAGMAEELGMEPKGFREGFQELLGKGLAKHCPKALCLVVPKFIQHNMPENPNVITSWRESIHMAPECDLLDIHMSLVAQQVKGLPEPFVKAFAKAFPIPFGKGMPIQEQEQEQLQEQDNTPLPPSPGGSVDGEEEMQQEIEQPSHQPPSFQSLPNPNPPIPPPPPSRSRLTVAQMQRFEQWYRQYPKKVSRGQAEKAWLTVERMNDVDVDGMVDKLEEQKGSPDWLKENGRYIPHPATYLNAKKWLDEADAPESSDDLFDNYVAAGLKAQFG